jgi:ferredoxin
LEEGLKVNVDFGLCEGHGQCVMAAPDVFDLADGADQVTVLQAEPPEDQRGMVDEAAALCPVLAITIEG